MDAHLDRQSNHMIEDYLNNFKHEDLAFLTNAASSQPGKTVDLVDLISREVYEKTRFYREFACQWGMQQALSTCWLEPVSGLTGFLSLWRKSLHNSFSELERAELECLIPHLAEAHRICRIITMRQPDKAFRQTVAISNQRGSLLEVEPSFFELLVKEWPTWRRNAILPKELLPVLTQQQAYHGERRGRTGPAIGRHGTCSYQSIKRVG